MADNGLYCPWCKQQVPEDHVQEYVKTSRGWKEGTSRPANKPLSDADVKETLGGKPLGSQ